MLEIPSLWEFRKMDMIPILEIIGTCENTNAEPLLVNAAIHFIEKAKEYKGIPYGQRPSNNSNNSKLVVSLALIFPSQVELDKYGESIKRKFT